MSDDDMMDGGSNFWAFELLPGKTYTQTPPMDLKVTQAALAGSAKDNGRVVVSVMIDGGQFTLGSLRLGHCEQFPLDLYFEEGTEVTFKVEGKNSVHLLGYYVEQQPDELDGYDSFDETAFDEEGASFDEEGDEEAEDFISRSKGQDRVEILEEKQHGDAKPATAAAEETDKKKKKNKKRKEPEDQSPAQDAKKVKQVENGKPQTPAAKEKPQTPAAKEKPQTPATKEKPQTPAAKEKPQTPAPKERPQTPTKEAQTPGKKDQSAKKESQTPNKKIELVEPVVRKLPNGLVIEDLTIGSGAEVPAGKKVSVKYVGKLTSGKVFDSAQGRPFTFRLGASQVIKGWDIGVKGMRKGGVRRLTIPSALAYGAKGAPPTIPPNSTLVFDVELVEFK